MDNYILKKKDFKLPSNLTNLINDLNPLITITLNYRHTPRYILPNIHSHEILLLLLSLDLSILRFLSVRNSRATDQSTLVPDTT